MKSFFKNKGPFNINILLKKTNYVKKTKFKNQKIKDISTLKDADKHHISFLESPRYLDDLWNTKASFCLVKEEHVSKVNKLFTQPIISSNPLLDFILIAKEFYPDSVSDNYKFKQNINYLKYKKHGTYIDSSVKIGKNFQIGLNSVLKKNIKIGNNVKIGSNCVISNSIIEDNVIINDGTVIGKIGYGFKLIKNNLNFIPHIGYVYLMKSCYIGSNCSIDRGSFSNTVIGKNTMIDNNVHIAHNVKIGSNCLIAGQVGIAGSTNIGNSCMLGGQVGISGHLKIGDNVQVGGHSGVLKNISSNLKVMGFPAVALKKFVKRKYYD